jgi:cytochrome P450
VTDPNLISQILLDRTKSSKIIKERRVYHIADALVGNSLLSLSDGPKWKHQRKIITPAFSQTFLEDANVTVAHLLYSKAFPSLERQGGTTEVLEWSTRVASEVLGLVGFSRSFDSFPDSSSHPQTTVSLFDNFNSLLKTMYHRALSPPFIEFLPTKENWGFANARRQLNTIISQIVRERLVEENQLDTASANSTATDEKDGIRSRKAKDLLSYMMLKDEDGRRLSHQELFGNVRMFLFAGHDTSAATLAYALWELASHSEMQQRLRQEVDELFSKEQPPLDSDDYMVIPAYKNIMQLQYLDAIVKETLRLHPPAAIGREAIEDITLQKDGAQTYTIPKGSSIYIFPYYTQRLEPYFDHPEDFRPERFLNADGSISSIAMRNPSYYPFSIGPRNCVGQPLAIMELKTVLVHLIRRFVITPNSKSAAPLPVLLLNIRPHEVLLDFQNRFDR